MEDILRTGLVVRMCPLSKVGCLGSWLEVLPMPAPEPARERASSCKQQSLRLLLGGIK